jgi:hypothetical protein
LDSEAGAGWVNRRGAVRGGAGSTAAAAAVGLIGALVSEAAGSIAGKQLYTRFANPEAPWYPELVVAGSVVPAVVPPVHTVFDAGPVAVSRSDAGGEKRASRSGCEHKQERSCDPPSRERGKGAFHRQCSAD